MSYRPLIENDELGIFKAAKCVEASSIGKITKRNVHQCIEKLRKRKVKEKQLYLVEQAVKCFTMNMQKANGNDSV